MTSAFRSCVPSYYSNRTQSIRSDVSQTNSLLSIDNKDIQFDDDDEEDVAYSRCDDLNDNRCNSLETDWDDEWEQNWSNNTSKTSNKRLLKATTINTTVQAEPNIKDSLTDQHICTLVHALLQQQELECHCIKSKDETEITSPTSINRKKQSLVTSKKRVNRNNNKKTIKHRDNISSTSLLFDTSAKTNCNVELNKKPFLSRIVGTIFGSDLERRMADGLRAREKEYNAGDRILSKENLTKQNIISAENNKRIIFKRRFEDTEQQPLVPKRTQTILKRNKQQQLTNTQTDMKKRPNISFKQVQRTLAKQPQQQITKAKSTDDPVVHISSLAKQQEQFKENEQHLRSLVNLLSQIESSVRIASSDPQMVNESKKKHSTNIELRRNVSETILSNGIDETELTPEQETDNNFVHEKKIINDNRQKRQSSIDTRSFLPADNCDSDLALNNNETKMNQLQNQLDNKIYSQTNLIKPSMNTYNHNCEQIARNNNKNDDTSPTEVSIKENAPYKGSKCCPSLGKTQKTQFSTINSNLTKAKYRNEPISYTKRYIPSKSRHELRRNSTMKISTLTKTKNNRTCITDCNSNQSNDHSSLSSHGYLLRRRNSEGRVTTTVQSKHTYNTPCKRQSSSHYQQQQQQQKHLSYAQQETKAWKQIRSQLTSENKKEIKSAIDVIYKNLFGIAD